MDTEMRNLRSTTYENSEEDEQEALKWSAFDKLQRLPTNARARIAVLHGVAGGFKDIDLRDLEFEQRQELVDRLIRDADDNEEFLRKLKSRIDSVSLDLPTIEVRFENLFVEGEAYVGKRALPTIVNSIFNVLELLRREKDRGIQPDPYLDALMKASLLNGLKEDIVTDYVLKFEINAVIIASVFLQAKSHRSTVEDGVVYLGALFTSLNSIVFSGFFELPMLVDKLPIFYKQRDLLFYPSWVFTLPASILAIPTSFVEATLWTASTYYIMGFDPSTTRFLKQFLILTLSGQMSYALFRCIGAFSRNPTVANTGGSLSIVWLLIFSGFVVSRENMPKWLVWGFWTSPMSYVQTALSVNEFLGDSWKHILPGTNETVGVAVLKSRGVFTSPYWYWVGLIALIVFIFIINGLTAFALAYLNQFGKSQSVLLLEDPNKETDEEKLPGRSKSRIKSSSNGGIEGERGMILPFTPLSITFENIRYSVDMPKFKILCRRNIALIEELSIPTPNTEDLYFPTMYPRSSLTQFKACLWKQHKSYWRNAPYNTVRFLYGILVGVMFGCVFWNLGSKRNTQQDIFNAMGAMFMAITNMGTTGAASLRPVALAERTVFYRERATGMYAALPYAFAQVQTKSDVHIDTFILNMSRIRAYNMSCSKRILTCLVILSIKKSFSSL
ncbi:hypothetical protein ACFE04_017158 [Oxalis oulophora]